MPGAAARAHAWVVLGSGVRRSRVARRHLRERRDRRQRAAGEPAHRGRDGSGAHLSATPVLASAFPVTACDSRSRRGRTARSLGQSTPCPGLARPGSSSSRHGVPPQDRQLAGDAPDRTQWPFRIADKAASMPDLVLHVGDYHYRGARRASPSPGQPVELRLGTGGRPVPPGASLMAARPGSWSAATTKVPARRAGWFRFLDTRVRRGHTPVTTANGVASYNDPYAVPWRRRSHRVRHRQGRGRGAEPTVPADLPPIFTTFQTELNPGRHARQPHGSTSDEPPAAGVRPPPGTDGRHLVDAVGDGRDVPGGLLPARHRRGVPRARARLPGHRLLDAASADVRGGHRRRQPGRAAARSVPVLGAAGRRRHPGRHRAHQRLRVHDHGAWRAWIYNLPCRRDADDHVLDAGQRQDLVQRHGFLH